VQPETEFAMEEEALDMPPKLMNREVERLSIAIENLTDLRNRLLNKQTEIKELKAYYFEGIQKIKDDVLKEMREKNITTLENAIKNKRIELGMLTIQRRKTYINKLDSPMESLHQHSEELLYLKRKALLFQTVLKNISGIQTAQLEKQIDATMNAHESSSENLTIDDAPSRTVELETIWKEMFAGKVRPRSAGDALSKQEKLNQAIQKELCNGDYTRVDKLTSLTQKSAECLVSYRGNALFLHELKNLTPEVAKQLSLWEGNWLALNGITSLGEASAKYLSQWQGETLSLNGLKILNSKSAKYLAQF